MLLPRSKNILRYTVLVLASYYAATALLFSGIHHDSGTTGAQILEITPDARSLGMGGAYTAVANDGGAAFYNPAGLAAVNHTEISLSRNQLFENIEQAYLGYVYSLQDIKMVNIQDPGTFSATWNAISTGDIPGRDAQGNLTRNFTVENNVLSFAYGKTVSETDIACKFMAGVR